MQRVYLNPINNDGFVCIISDDESGVEVTSQVGGYACNHEVVGNVVSITSIPLPKELFQYFETAYGGWCCEGMEEKDIEPIEKMIPEFKLTDLDKCQEAWLYGTYRGEKCLLVFCNSD